tara:strand:+ start:87 stop:1556 length:1470 start_codon:yes stop_codon:yes gene_type:complete
MNVLLIEPPFYCLQGIKSGKVSLGLAMLAGAIKEKGWDVSIYSPDLEFDTETVSSEGVVTHMNRGYLECMEERLTGLLSELKPDVVGISVWTARYNNGLLIARIVRETCGNQTKIVMGGIHATMLPEGALDNMEIDYIIAREGERAIVELLDHLDNNQANIGNGVRNLYYRDKNNVIRSTENAYIKNLDSLPMPAYDTYLNAGKLDPNMFGSLISARGCPFLCTYCASHILWSRKVRYHSSKYIIGLIEYLYNAFGTRKFRFNDDTFNLDRNRLFEFCRLLQAENLPIEWEADIRGDLADYDSLKAMRDAGCKQVNIGVETASETIIKQVRKNLDLEKVKNTFRICKEMGIKTIGYFMIGFPGETEEQVNKTIGLIEKLKPDNPIISIFTPYPGTEAFDIEVRNGTIDPSAIDWDQFFHHSENANYSGVISDGKWAMLVNKADRVRNRILLRNRFKNKINQTDFIDRYKTGGLSSVLDDVKSLWMMISR